MKTLYEEADEGVHVAVDALKAIHEDDAETLAWTEVEGIEMIAGRELSTLEILAYANFHTEVGERIRDIVKVRAAEALRSHLKVVK